MPVCYSPRESAVTIVATCRMKVSIIIPTYNHWDDCLKPCLESLAAQTDFVGVEVIIVANGCADDTRSLLVSDRRWFTTVWFDSPLGYTKAVNAGLLAATGEFVVLLNNDTKILPSPKNDWLDKLLKPFDDPEVGVTGPMKEWNEAAQRKFIIFFCAAFRRKFVQEIGYLDEAFSPGYGEDVDYCAKIEDRGYKIVQVPDEAKRYYADNRATGDFPIYHAGNVTFKNWPGGEELIARNWKILSQRYGKDKPQAALTGTSNAVSVEWKVVPQSKTIDITRAKRCDGYMTDEELLFLAEHAQKANTIIEVGSWHGKSTRALADHTQGVIYAVDHWNGSLVERDTSHASAREMDGDHAYFEFNRNLWDHVASGRVRTLRMTGRNAARQLNELRVQADLIFIDAGHTYEEVKADIADFLPLLAPGGLLCGHDFDTPTWPGVTQAVREFNPVVAKAANTSIWFHELPAMQVQPSVTPTPHAPPTPAEPAPSKPKRRVFDCFPFFNEGELLQIRLNELKDVVDFHVIVESDTTHQGARKGEYWLETHKKQFAEFWDKIIYVKLKDEFPDGTNPWQRERWQRDAITQGAKDLTAEDILIISDADEIPKASAVRAFTKEMGLATLPMSLHYYFLNYRGGLGPNCSHWREAKIVSADKLFRGMTPCQIRYTDAPNVMEPGDTSAGWHFSYMGGITRIQEKIRSFAHAEYNKPEFLDEDFILKRMTDGLDIYGRATERPFALEWPPKDLPEHVMANVGRFAQAGLIRKLVRPNI